MPRAPVTTYSMHGGAGGIMSIGLMREVSFDFMERCTKSLYSTGACELGGGHEITFESSFCFWVRLQQTHAAGCHVNDGMASEGTAQHTRSACKAWSVLAVARPAERDDPAAAPGGGRKGDGIAGDVLAEDNLRINK